MKPAGEGLSHVLTFDIEDWFHIVEIEALADPEKWDTMPTLVEHYTDLVLERLDAHGTRATFFYLGWIAKKYPDLVRRTAEAGHEIGCHSYWHRRVELLGPREFRRDTKEALEVIEDAAGTKVLGYRAPSFSITPGAEWAFDVLMDLGFAYDASLFPGTHGHGGYPCRQEMHDFDGAPSGRSLPELPMSILKLGPVRLPFSGGGYLRALPIQVIEWGFERFTRQGIPVVVYLHPRDLAPDTPRVPMPMKRRLKCYTGLETTLPKLNRLLERYRFDTCASIMGLAGQVSELDS